MEPQARLVRLLHCVSLPLAAAYMGGDMMLIASDLQYTNGLDPMPGDRVSDRGGRLGTVMDVRSGDEAILDGELAVKCDLQLRYRWKFLASFKTSYLRCLIHASTNATMRGTVGSRINLQNTQQALNKAAGALGPARSRVGWLRSMLGFFGVNPRWKLGTTSELLRKKIGPEINPAESLSPAQWSGSLLSSSLANLLTSVASLNPFSSCFAVSTSIPKR